MGKKDLKILILDDEKLYRMTLVELLKGYGDIFEAEDKKGAFSILRNIKPDISFVDLKLGENFEGLKIIKECSKKGIYSVVLSSYVDEEIIEKAYADGCQDFFEKGNEEKSIKEVMDKFLLSRDKMGFENFIKNDFITQDEKTIEDLEFVFNNSTSNIPMFFSGPTGIGKTRLARLIHDFSGKKGKFIQLNCSEINSNLLESELFGHKKGSFTGAISDKVGLIKSSDGGTLFLDEICSMPMDIQVKLLKVIEEKTFYPVGSDNLASSNFRLISASQHSIIDKIQKGEFRSDLFYRISGINLRLRPLKERQGDIPLIINSFLKGKRKVVLKEKAIHCMVAYSWPGNIRELKKVIELLSTKDRGVINYDDLPNYVRGLSHSPHALMTITDEQYQCALQHGLKKLISEIERQVIKRKLREAKDGVLTTLRDLKISRTKYYSSIETKGLT